MLVEYLADNWGSLASGLGVLLSAAGVVYAYLARRAAKSAESASREARQAIAQTLTAADLQRAVDCIHRLLIYQRQAEWGAAIELYHNLRQILNDILAYLPENEESSHQTISEAVSEITELLRDINRRETSGSPGDGVGHLTDSLITIQEKLEELASRLRFSSSEDAGG